MGTKKLLCLGRFEKHSCDTWWLGHHRAKGLYYRECVLMGCSFWETAKELVPIGKTEIVGQPAKHIHRWDFWRTTADQTGLYTPPWLYKRECKNCGARQMAENLKKN